MERIWLKRYQQGVPPSIDPGRYHSLVEILQEAFTNYTGLPAYHNLGKTIRFHDLDRLSHQFGSYLQQHLGLAKGTRVALMMPNILQYPVALFGLLRAGLVAVNVNPLYTARELKHQLQDSGAQAIVVYANAARLLQRILPKTSLQHVIVTQIGDMLDFPKSLLVNLVLRHVKRRVPAWHIPSAIAFKAALASGERDKLEPVALGPNDMAFLQYTGGTTGVAKGAILTHGNITANILQATTWIKSLITDGRMRQEIIITPLPLYHIFALTANCLTFTAIGALNVLITNPRDISGFVKELSKWPFTAITGVNTLYNALLNHPNFAKLDFSALKIALGGGMAVQRSVAERWQAVTGTPLIEAYGLTETSPAVCINPMDIESYNGFIGLPISSTVVAIRDEQEQEVPLGQIGEICVKGPQVMQSYWQRPGETRIAFSADGFFKSGDLGYITKEGFVKLVERKKDMILVSGFNVYPNEIEDVITAHPKVLECAAVGVPDARSGEAVKLFVVKKEATLTEEELSAYCRSSLAGYKVPRYFEFRTNLPKSNVGKILRKELRS